MEEKVHATAVNPSRKTTQLDPEKTIVTPRFDEKSIQKARPAVPLAGSSARRLWPLALVALCVVASLGGGILGGVFLSLYQRHATPATAKEAVTVETDQSLQSPAIGAQQTADGGQASSSLSVSRDRVVPESEKARPEEHATTAEDTHQAQQARSPRNPQGVGGQQRVDDEKKREQQPTAAVRVGDSLAATATREEGDQAARVGDTGNTHAVLRGALDEWVAATNARNIQKQMSFYNPTVNAFYLTRNASREDVRAEKSRVFGSASVIDVRAGTPDIKLSPDGRTATMRFRKKYAIEGGTQDRRGEVLQELRWQRTGKGWKIVSERDLRVLP
ncbi:MAG: hypothetical protein LC754_03110 [Acidobacteria bacterium]|nr:hypothetical protein [Acidobacteriota bacterium]